MKKNGFVVVGCGVTGLSTAICLQEQHNEVVIITRDLPEHSTSSIAPAMWHPYKVAPDERMRRWASVAFQYFKKYSTVAKSGVHPTTIVEYYATTVLEPWYAEAVDSFRRLQATELPQGYVDGFSTESFVIDTSVYLNFLLQIFYHNGGRLEVRSVESLEEFIHSDTTVINCSGLSSRELAHDSSVYPISGQVLRVASAYSSETTCVIDENGRRAVCYIVPRTHDVLLGGTAVEHDWSTEVNDLTSADILRKAQEMVPELTDAVILDARVGLRPARPTVRVEQDAQYPWLIHNYGHSGAGFSLSWGCAAEVSTMIRESAAQSVHG